MAQLLELSLSFRQCWVAAFRVCFKKPEKFGQRYNEDADVTDFGHFGKRLNSFQIIGITRHLLLDYQVFYYAMILVNAIDSNRREHRVSTVVD